MQRTTSKTTKIPIGRGILRPSSQTQVRPLKKDAQAKENLDKIKNQIEESIKPQHLPSHKTHPFDLSPEEIAELKEEFPEFRKKKTEG
jgi:hypothetical protein